MNPHDRINHKILSLARLPVPTLLHLAYVFTFEQSHTLRTYPGHLKQQCRRWDLNPHDRIDHKILSLARLPIPTLLHVNFSMSVVQTIYYHPPEQMSTLFSIFLFFYFSSSSLQQNNVVLIFIHIKTMFY